MKDILRIYSKTTNWGDTLLHTIRDDLVDYNISTKINTIGTGSIRLSNGNKWYDNIGVDKWDGTNETVRVWRLHDTAGNLLISGIINSCEKSGGDCTLGVQDMNGLLRRRVIDNKSFSQQAGTYILTDSTAGLLPVYLTNLYSNFANDAAYITYNTDAASTTYLRDWKFDGTYLNDSVFDVARASYGTNGNSFFGNLYETWDGSKYVLNFDFKEKESAANTATLTWGDVQHDDFSFRNWSQIHYNKVYVNGLKGVSNFVPKDKDWWTNQADDAAYQSFWSDTNMTIARWTSSPDPKVGSSCINAEVDSSGSAAHLRLDLDDAQAYSAIYTPDATYFSNGNGLVYSGDIDIYLNFWIYIDFAQAARAYVRTELYGHAVGGIEEFIGGVGIGGKPQYLDEVQYSITGGCLEDNWSKIRFRLQDIVSPSEYDYITGVNFEIPTADSAADDIYIDGLYFEFVKDAKGSATDETPTYLREYPHSDSGLTSDYDCTNMAQNLLRELNRESYAGQCSLHATKRNYLLRAGTNIGLIVPIHNVNITTGQTLTKLLVEGVTYQPSKQTLHFDRSWTEQDAIEAANRNIRLGNKVT